jgi:hypothetical protein
MLCLHVCRIGKDELIKIATLVFDAYQTRSAAARAKSDWEPDWSLMSGVGSHKVNRSATTIKNAWACMEQQYMVVGAAHMGCWYHTH